MTKTIPGFARVTGNAEATQKLARRSSPNFLLASKCCLKRNVLSKSILLHARRYKCTKWRLAFDSATNNVG